MVVEDVVTAAGQAIASRSQLRGLRAQIDVVLCVIDREAGGVESLVSHGLQLRALFTAAQLRQVA